MKSALTSLATLCFILSAPFAFSGCSRTDDHALTDPESLENVDEEIKLAGAEDNPDYETPSSNPSEIEQRIRKGVEKGLAEKEASTLEKIEAGTVALAPSTGLPSHTGAGSISKAPHDVHLGERIYLQNCSSCHGPRGAGDGAVGQGLDPKPAKHNDGRFMNKLTNQDLFRAIKDGGAAVGKSPLMAPWGSVLSDDQIWDTVAFIRSLAVPAYTGPMP